MRDMSKAEFDAACKRRGFRDERIMGYYQIGGGVSVSVFNAGSTRREWLAYLIAQAKKLEEKREREQ